MCMPYTSCGVSGGVKGSENWSKTAHLFVKNAEWNAEYRTPNVSLCCYNFGKAKIKSSNRSKQVALVSYKFAITVSFLQVSPF